MDVFARLGLHELGAEKIQIVQVENNACDCDGFTVETFDFQTGRVAGRACLTTEMDRERGEHDVFVDHLRSRNGSALLRDFKGNERGLKKYRPAVVQREGLPEPLQLRGLRWGNPTVTGILATLAGGNFFGGAIRRE
ncbi:MAG: hypothetical protein WAR24_14550 [Candidatus Acidiferrales bacterium]